ncbi:MAG: CvpA family protein [Eubacterium sp.]|nr:CvpA family protein [Eubacterium sp.]
MTVLGITFNYVDLAIADVVLVAAVIGFCRGIIINIINFIRLSVGAFLCFFVAENACVPVYESLVKPRLVTAVEAHIAAAADPQAIAAQVAEFNGQLPKVIADNVNLDALELSSADIAESIVTSVFEPIVTALVKGVLFIAVFLVFFLLTGVLVHFISKALNKKNKTTGRTSAVRKTDRVLGLLFGILKSCVIVLAIVAVLMYILELKPELAVESRLWEQISSARLVGLINEINPFNAITEGYI